MPVATADARVVHRTDVAELLIAVVRVGAPMAATVFVRDFEEDDPFLVVGRRIGCTSLAAHPARVIRYVRALLAFAVIGPATDLNGFAAGGRNLPKALRVLAVTAVRWPRFSASPNRAAERATLCVSGAGMPWSSFHPFSRSQVVFVRDASRNRFAAPGTASESRSKKRNGSD